MAKLSMWQRDRVTAALLAEAFDARRAALDKRRQALAARALILRYGRDAFAQFDAVPEGWLPTGKRVYVAIGTDQASRSVDLAEARALPAEIINYGRPIFLDAKLGHELLEIDRGTAALSSEREALTRGIRAALAGFGTEAALRDGWPAAWACLTSAAPPVPNLPAVRVEEIDQRIAQARAA